MMYIHIPFIRRIIYEVFFLHICIKLHHTQLFRKSHFIQNAYLYDITVYEYRNTSFGSAFVFIGRVPRVVSLGKEYCMYPNSELKCKKNK